MRYKTLTFDLEDNVAWITLNRPAVFNALGLDLASELCDVANCCGLDRSVRAVVLTGEGDKAFCAGGDVSSFAVNADSIGPHLTEIATALHTAVSRFAWMDAPLIAMVNGVAAGAGLSLVAASDLAIAADHARFTSAYAQIGLSPDGSSSYFLTRLIGVRRTAELYLTNRTLTAEEALDWGLINRVVPAAALKDEAAALAAKLAQGPTRAYGAAKKLLLMATQDGLESQMAREARQIVALGQSRDGLEGVRAFVERRKPAFHGE